ncbi:MAG: hypothetical protein AAGI91_14065 [Bacteroidota bacterium]
MRPLLQSCLLAAALTLPLAPGVLAQGAPSNEEAGPGLQFNGYGRSTIQQTEIGGTVLDTDTLTVQDIADGEFVLDLAVNARPNSVTEVQGIIRLRNEFGGFFGAGATLDVRELWARGVIADVLRYRLGDMDAALSPYTLFLPDADGVVNEPELFRPQREAVYYDEFYTGRNTRRLQGAKLDFGLSFDRGLDAADFQIFLARLRSTNFTDVPTRFIGGGRGALTLGPFGPYGTLAKGGLNVSYTWDDLKSGDANTGIRNAVISLDTDVRILDQDAFDLHLVGESGWSLVRLRENTEDSETEEETAPIDEILFEDTDTFIEVGLAGTVKAADLGLSAMFVNVGPEFYSASAQSKRIDYTRTKSTFNRIGSDADLRPVSLFDLSRDPALYTFRIADQLMAYDPRYGNVLPFGRATPNRRGARLGAAYAPDGVPVDAALDLALLTEIRGEGTDELKNFVLLRGEATVEVNEFIGWDRMLGLTLGTQVENTSRGGEPAEEVDLASILFEAGVSAEVYDRLDVLLGAKLRTSSGRDYVPQIENFNDIRDFFEPFVTDDQESLIGAGLRYRFRDDISLTVQVQRFSYSSDPNPDDEYTLGQVFALYTMTF